MKHTINSINDIENLAFNYNEETHVVYESEHLSYNFLVLMKKNSDKLLAFSNGAINPAKKKPPVFMRRKWKDDFPYSMIFMDDPTIHKNGLKLGWGQGTVEEFALEIYSEIIKKISSCNGVESNKVYYYGSSAGGFMSLILSSMHKDSKAIVNNPQTDVEKYHHANSIPLIENVYGSVEEAYDKYVHRLRVSAAFEYYGNTPEVHYSQNRLCYIDVKKHYTPFMQDMSKKRLGLDKIQLYLYHDSAAGHSPLNKENTVHLINTAIAFYEIN